MKNKASLNAEGCFEGIDYKYCSGTPFRSRFFCYRNLLKVKGFIVELFTIINRKKQKKAEVLIITSNSFFGIFYYSMLAKLLSIVSINDQVEYWSSHDNAFFRKFDSFLNDHFYFYLVDSVIVTSDFLGIIVKKKCPNKPILKIPVLCDFKKFTESNKSNAVVERPYLLFCGSSSYLEIIIFIINSYVKFISRVDLIIVTSGDSRNITKILNYIKSNRYENIMIKSNIPFTDLILLYKNSKGLLIPLRPTLQDIARFPFKIGEYTASARPIVSVNVGEISNYFIDGVNAYLAEKYTVRAFESQIENLLDDNKNAETIGSASFQLGLKYFEYKSNGAVIYNFLFNRNSE